MSGFYLRENKMIGGKMVKKGTPIATAGEVIQVGGFVLAKDVTPTTLTDPRYAV